MNTHDACCLPFPRTRACLQRMANNGTMSVKPITDTHTHTHISYAITSPTHAYFGELATFLPVSQGGVVLFDCSNNRRLGSQQWLVSEAAETPPAPAGSAAATASAVFTEWVSPHRSSQRTIKHVSGRCLVAAPEGTRNMTRVALEDCDLNAASVPLLRGVAQDELSRRGVWEWVSEHA